MSGIAALVVQKVGGAGDRWARRDEHTGRHLSHRGRALQTDLWRRRGTRARFVEVGETQAAIDLTLLVPYGRSIPEVAKSMHDNVIQRVENLTGLDVTEVNITAKDVFFPEQQ